jgi:UDP:flavonoid glycosyltransferase YjiC (YdhE family)
MRILVTCLANHGDFHPLIPLARACQATGHELAFASDENMRQRVERLGFDFFPAGGDWRALLFERHPELTFTPTVDQMPITNAAGFAGTRIEVTLPALLDVCKAWRPDLLLRDHLSFAGCLAAEELGIPHVAVNGYASGHLVSQQDPVREPLNRWREARGLPPDPELRMLYRFLELIPFPPSLRHPDAPLLRTSRRIQPLVFSDSREEPLPEWIDDLPPGPVVHATLGTVADRPDLLRTIIEGLADEPLTLIVATGPRRDPITLGALPRNVRAAPYISHQQLLPRCDAIITHAGAGTLIASIILGLPLVLIPMFGDQPANAEMAEAAGVALVLQPSTITPAAVREATYAVLNEPRRQQFSKLQQEIAALPPVERAVGWLERIARERAPLPMDA